MVADVEAEVVLDYAAIQIGLLGVEGRVGFYRPALHTENVIVAEVAAHDADIHVGGSGLECGVMVVIHPARHVGLSVKRIVTDATRAPDE